MPRKKHVRRSDLTPLDGDEAAASGGAAAPDVNADADADASAAAPASGPNATSIAMPAGVTPAQLPSTSSPAHSSGDAADRPTDPDGNGNGNGGSGEHVAVAVDVEPNANQSTDMSAFPPPPEEQQQQQVTGLSEEEVKAGEAAGVVSSSGEIDVLFLEKLAPEYECLQCRSVLRFPMRFKPCGHRVCSSCLDTFLECAPAASDSCTSKPFELR